jgi:uncharacterized membrane protein
MEFLLAVLLPFSFWIFKWLEIPFWLSGLFLLPIVFLKKNRYWGKLIAWPALILGVASLFSQSALFIYFYPVIVNAALLMVFVISLFSPQTIIEKIARIKDSSFSDCNVAYVKKVTIAWSIFFVLNGSIALITIFIPNKGYWSIYNGGISYLLMGMMFLGEWLIRQRYIKHAP